LEEDGEKKRSLEGNVYGHRAEIQSISFTTNKINGGDYETYERYPEVVKS